MTLAPTETAIPSFHYITQPTLLLDDSYEWNSPGWIYSHTDGGTISVVDDQTYGKVLKYEVTEKRDPYIRAQLDKGGDPLAPPFSVLIPYWFSSTYKPGGVGNEGWANVGNIFNSTDRIDKGFKGFSILATVNIDQRRIPYIIVPEAYDMGNWHNTYYAARPLEPEVWNIIELKCLEDGTIQLTINGPIVASGPSAPSNTKLRQLVVTHGGAYGAKLPVGSFVLNGPIEIRSWA